ncbi:MAG: DNA polymerase Y family protein, partial [Planctomycetota bacterium]
MKRAMSLWFPMLQIEAWRRHNRFASHDGQIVLLERTAGQRKIVSACCEKACTAGVHPGMSLADARSAFPPALVKVAPDNPKRSMAALTAIGRWAHRFSPRVAIDGTAGLLIDITGCNRTLGGERTIRSDAIRRLGSLGVSTRCVIAPTYASASAIARFGDSGIYGETQLREQIATLPVCALCLDESDALGLNEVGIERIGQLMDLPRSVLPARFGDELLVRLDRMLGQAIETIDPIRPNEQIRVSLSLDGPTNQWDSIEHMVRSLLDELSAQLDRGGIGLLRLLLTLQRSDLPPARLAFVVSQPTHDTKHLWSLIRPRLERTHLGFGIEGIDLLCERYGRMPQSQGHAWERGDDGVSERDAFARLVDELSNRLGRDRVLQAHHRASHVPERAVVMRPATDRGPQPSIENEQPPRPPLMFTQPSEVDVVALTPDGPVHRLVWRGE